MILLRMFLPHFAIINLRNKRGIRCVKTTLVPMVKYHYLLIRTLNNKSLVKDDVNPESTQ